MKIKIGTVHEDRTCYGNRFYIEIEDTTTNDNSNLRGLVGKKVAVVIDSATAIDDLIQETEMGD